MGMLKRRIDMSGKTIGLLTVLEYNGNNKKGFAMWLCQCKCGNKKIISGSNLSRNWTHSCGCLNKIKPNKDKITHGQSHTRMYRVWATIKNRCFNPKVHEYHNYGGRGITMCDKWKNSFKEFIKIKEPKKEDSVKP